MAALRKLKHLVDNLTQSPVEEDAETTSDSSSGIFCTGVFATPRQPLPNPDFDKDLLSKLPQLYFEAHSEDPSHYELEELEKSISVREETEEDGVPLEMVANKRKLLRKQQEVVCRMLSDAVLQNSTAFQDELTRVIELQNSLKDALDVASTSRRSLQTAQINFTGHSLRLFAQQRRRVRYRHLLQSLQLLRKLKAADASLRDLMEAEDYPGAIRLCLECQEASQRHGQFRCIAELGSKLQDTLVLIEEGLDVALGRIPSRFNAELFSKLQRSYALLGKTETSVDQLLMHFASTIHNASFNIVLGAVELCNPNNSLNTTINTSTNASNVTTSFNTSNNASTVATSLGTSATDDSGTNPFLNASSSQSSTSQTSTSLISSSSSQTFSLSALNKKPYSDLCRYVSSDSFIPCLIDLCKAFFGILRNYDEVVKWFMAKLKEHEETLEDEEDAFGTPPPPLQRSSASGSENIASAFAYVKQKLEHGVVRIWQDVQQKVKIYLLASDLSSYKFDDFMQVLRIGNMLISVGAQFCVDSQSESLKDGLKKQSINYFKRYHKACLDELRTFLENESWILLPVKSSFALDQLHQFRFIRKSILTTSLRGRPRSTSSSAHSGSDSGASSSKVSSAKSNALYDIPRRVFENNKEGETPFDLLGKDEEFVEDFWDDDEGGDDGGRVDSDSDPEELKRDTIEEDEHDTSSFRRNSVKKTKFHSNVPLVTNATLNVLRLFGKYIQMMQALEPIASQVLFAMTQLYDFLFYSTFLFFGRSKSTLLGGSNFDASTLTGSSVGDKMLPTRLRSTLRRIRDDLILQPSSDDSTTICDGSASPRDVVDGSEERLKLAAPRLASCLESTEDATSFFSFAERVAASESLVFLTNQIEQLRAHVEKLVPHTDRHTLQQFYGTTVTQAVELRRPIYRIVAVQAIDYEAVLNSLVAVSFDIDDIMSQHNRYVDAILSDFRKMSKKIGEIAKTTPISAAVTGVLWEHVIRLASRTFVEGFSCVKKCTNEGRALMQLDYQHFLMKLETLTHLRPIPDREYVEAYIKAFYLPEASFEQWIVDKRGVYSPKQLAGLLSCVPHLNKKARQHLYALIEEIVSG